MDVGQERPRMDAVSLEEQTLDDLEEELEHEILKVMSDRAERLGLAQPLPSPLLDDVKDDPDDQRNVVLFLCDNCQQEFFTSDGLVKHMADIHPQQLQVDLQQGLQARDESEFAKCSTEWNGAEETNEELCGNMDDQSDWNCPFCPQSQKTDTKTNFHQHLRTGHGLKDGCLYKCHTCERVFKTRAQLLRHSRLHTSVRPFVCKQCDKKFPWPEHLQAHLYTHKSRSFKCGECSSEFTSTSALRRHERTHKDAFRYVCDTCGHGFHVSEPYKIHMRKHAQVRPFECGVCGKKYLSRSACRRHTLTHTDNRRYACHQCDKKFRDKQTLDRHALVHSGKRPFVCPHCNLGLATNHNLRMHIAKIHVDKHNKAQVIRQLVSDSVQGPQTPLPHNNPTQGN